MTSTAVDFYYDVYVTGQTNLTGAFVLNTKLDLIYINTSTGSLTSNIMGYLVNISSDVQTQLNAKQSFLWNYNTGSGTTLYYLTPSSNCSLDITWNDTYDSFIRIGNWTNLVNRYIDFEDTTGTYALRIWRDTSNNSNIIHQGTANFNINAMNSATIHIQTSNTDRITTSDTLTIIYTNFSVFGSTTLTGAATLDNN